MPISDSSVAAHVQGFNADFRKFVSQAPPKAWAGLFRRLDSKTAEQTYKSWGAVPQLAVWDDEIKMGGAGGYAFTIHNVNYASGIRISKNLIADDQLGQIQDLIRGLAQKAAYWQYPSLHALIGASETDSLGTCFDGKALIATDHESGKSGAQSNTITGTGITSAALLDDWAAGLAKAATWKDDQGDATYIETDYFDTAIIPPSGPIWASFLTILDGTTALGQFKGARLIKNVVVDASLTDTNDWFQVATGGVERPFIFQDREAVYPESHTTPLMPDIAYTAKARGGFAYGHWNTVIKVKNS